MKTWHLLLLAGFVFVTILIVIGLSHDNVIIEPYEFLTVDSETRDLTIVDSSSGLEALDGGGLYVV